jgi:hypothetical protein
MPPVPSRPSPTGDWAVRRSAIDTLAVFPLLLPQRLLARAGEVGVVFFL